MARILLLEDDATFRDLVSAAMKRAGYEVTTAGDGQAGWDALDKAQPVADAQLQISDCLGEVQWTGRSDKQGVARVDGEVVAEAEMGAMVRDR